MAYLRKTSPVDFIITNRLPIYQIVPAGMLSVLIASRFLRKADGMLWLADAVQSIYRQEDTANRAIEIIVGIDTDTVIPPDAIALPVIYAQANSQYMASQANSLNAAFNKSQGEIIGFLDDDDQWFPKRLIYGLHDLQFADVISATALNHNADGTSRHTGHHYSIPSGWFMRRQTFLDIGPLDYSIRYHTDVEYLGRINQLGLLRILQTRTMPINNIDNISEVLQRFLNMAPLGSALHSTPETTDLIYKSLHNGALTLESQDDVHSAISDAQMASVEQRYGSHPY